MGWPTVTSIQGVIGGKTGATLLAIGLPLLFTILFSSVPDAPVPNTACEAAAYRTEIISLDPLMIYLHDFLRPQEIDSLLTTAEPLFRPSQVTKAGRKVDTLDRTSSTAGLPLEDPTGHCILTRARSFMGTVMVDGKDEMGPLQLVRYTSGQKFHLHHDFYESPQWAYDDSRRRFNRVASFFAILQDNCTDGETYFPYLRPRSSAMPDDAIMRTHEDGGLAFRPIKGNALFWMNLHADGAGDKRMMHAGLPVGEGLKTAMNIWPRQFYPID